MSRTRRYAVLLPGVVLGLALAASTMARWSRARGASATTTVRREDLVLSADLTGVLEAVHADVLGPPAVADVWDFKIAMLVPEGTTVRKGQPVLAFDTSELKRRLEQQRAESEQAAKEMEKQDTDLALRSLDDRLKAAEARARLRKYQLKLESPPELAAAKELTQARLDAALAEREVAFLGRRKAAASRAAASGIADLKARRDRAAAEVRSLEAAIAAMTIASPRDGVVIYRESWRGEKKKVGDTCWRAEKVLEIPDVSEMRVRGEVDEADAGRVAAGQAVKFKLDAEPDREYRGRVESVATVIDRAAAESPLKVVRLSIVLERTDRERMRPGMRVRGGIEVGRVKDALVLPVDAVGATPDGPIAWRQGWLGTEAVPVEIGRRNQERVEIKGGLAEGETVRTLAPLESGS